MYQKRVLHVQIISHETYCFFDVLVAIAVIVAKASTKTIRDRASAPHNLKLFGFIDVCKRLGIRIRFSYKRLRIPSKHPKCNKSGKISSSVNVSALSSDLVATGNEDVIDWADLGGT